MAIDSYATQLERVQTAIKDIEERGISNSVEGRSLSRADLQTLYDREVWLRRMVDRETQGGIRVRRVTPSDG